MKFARKPHLVEAVQVATDPQHSAQNRLDVEAIAHGRANPGSQNPNAFVVETPTGGDMANPGDWIVRHPDNRLEVLDRATFEATYGDTTKDKRADEPLEVGDQVLLAGEITALEPSSDTQAATVTLVTLETPRIGGAPLQLTVTARMLRKAPAEGGDPIG